MSNEDNVLDELKSLKVILNEVGAYIYTKNIDGNYTFANSLVLDLFNASLDEVIGKDDSSFFDLEISTELKENDKKVLLNGETIEKEEVNIIKSTGEKKIYWTVKKPIYDKSGIICGMCGISTDITERKKLVQDLKEQKYLLNTILNNIDAHVYMKDHNRVFRYVNSNVAKLFGFKEDEIIGKKDTDILPKEIADSFWEMDKKLFETNVKQTAEEFYTDDEGGVKHYWSTKLPYTMDDKTPALIGLSTDITEIQILKEELRIQSITDYLTGAFNRRFFVQEAEIEFMRSKRHHLDMSIMMLDLDFFKLVNDTHGHIIGDEVLIRIVKNCMNVKRKEDILCRLGGEEFAIILPHTNLENANELASRIQKYQEENPISGNWDGDINITFSIGISCIDSNDNSYEEIFSRCDDALYEAKNTGRNKVCIK